MTILYLLCSRVIQNAGKDGHDPLEDALAALDLVLHRLREGAIACFLRISDCAAAFVYQ
jgi:hypothetical protein